MVLGIAKDTAFDTFSASNVLVLILARVVIDDALVPLHVEKSNGDLPLKWSRVEIVRRVQMF